MYKRKLVKLAKRIDSLMPEYVGTEAECILEDARTEIRGLLEESTKPDGTRRGGVPKVAGDNSDT